jgi:nucleotidyltransferase AbiEii toxin of type IV toxin-antitoxin system
MSQQEILTRVIRALEASRTPYMLTGSLVSSFQGEPRSTHDVDIVVLLSQESAKALFAALSQIGGYIEHESIKRAIDTRGMFNLIEPELGIKVDFWILTDEPFDQSRWARRYEEHLLGLRIWVPSPEDTILSKLRWARLAGGSEKHLVDAMRVYELQHPALDREYLDRWARLLGVNDLWRELLARAVPLE